MFVKLYEAIKYFILAIWLAIRWSIYGVLFIIDAVFTFLFNIFKTISDVLKSFMDLVLPPTFSWYKILIYVIWLVVAIVYYVIYLYVWIYNIAHNAYLKLMQYLRP